MKFTGVIFTVGVILVLTPALGLPAGWKNFLLVILGLWLCGSVLSARLRKHQGKKTYHKKAPRSSDISFVENQAVHPPMDGMVSPNTNDQTPRA